MKIIRFIYLSLSFYAFTFLFGCNKSPIMEKQTRISKELNILMSKVGDLHNKGLNIFSSEKSSFIKNLKKYEKESNNKISNYSTLKNKSNQVSVIEEILEETRTYYIQYTQANLPEITFPNSIFDSLSFLPTDYYINPNNLTSNYIVETSPIIVSQTFESLVDQLIIISSTANSINEFNSLADGILISADNNLTSDTEFYAIAMGVAIGKSSFAYWNTQENIDYWNSILSNYSSNSIQRNEIKSNFQFEFNDDIKAMATADLAGAIRGGIMGGTVGSIGGPAGTFSGAVGGAFYTGLRSSTLAGAWRVAKRYFNW